MDFAPDTQPDAPQSLLEIAVDIARGAGDVTLNWFQSSSLEVQTKGDGSPVTEADMAAERYIRDRLEVVSPGSTLIGEEEGTSPGSDSGGLTWYIDPIDGTKSFTRGVPLYCTLLAAYDQYGPAVGVIHLPALAQTIYAGRGLGCFADGDRVRVSDVDELAGAYVTTSSYTRWPIEVLGRTKDAGMEMRGWGDGYGFALVAMGRVEAMVDLYGGSPWDFAPMPVIMAEAGGSYSDPEGNFTIQSRSAIATNGKLHTQVCKLVTG